MHTSGIPPMEPLEWSIAMNSTGRPENEWLTEMKRTAPNPMATIDEVIDYVAHCGYTTLGAPGEIMSYSNEGYAILSYVIDKAAGMPLEQFMQERIFAPLGMTRSILDNGIDAARALSGGNITSLFEVEDGVRTCDDCWSVLPPFRGCAMVKSTSRDMATYYRALSDLGMHEGQQAIPAHAVDLLIGRYHPLSAQATMCMGLYKREKAGHTICEHSGALHGVSTKGGLLLGEGYGFAVLCNQGDEDMDELMWCMYNAVMGLPLEESHQWFIPSNRSFSSPHMIRGRYIGHEGVPSIVGIHCEEGSDTLYGTRDGVDFKLIYCGGTRFLAVQPEDAGKHHLPFGIPDSRRACMGRPRRHAGIRARLTNAGRGEDVEGSALKLPAGNSFPAPFLRFAPVLRRYGGQCACALHGLSRNIETLPSSSRQGTYSLHPFFASRCQKHILPPLSQSDSVVGNPRTSGSWWGLGQSPNVTPASLT